MNHSKRSIVDGSDLRDRIIRSLWAQGFRVRNGAILPPKELSKERIRKLHETAVEHRIERARDSLFRMEKDLLAGSHRDMRLILRGSRLAWWRFCPIQKKYISSGMPACIGASRCRRAMEGASASWL